VVQHVPGEQPTHEECKQGISELRRLASIGIVSPINESAFSHPDFTCPSCNGNAREAEGGTFRYVDFQNFVLPNYASYLRKTAIEASAATHFGNTSLIRGGQYLYQSVPGVSLPAKRDISKRAALIDRLLYDSEMSLTGRMVLDVGCNIGMMSAHYLARGAAWVHGWDQSSVIEHAERLLLALGCTRFSLTGGSLAGSHDFRRDLPGRLVPLAERSVVSYLAVRAHLGWLPALGALPWDFMMYEGHEGEGRDDTVKYLHDLNGLVPIRTLALTEIQDGDSDTRQFALLQRIREAGPEPGESPLERLLRSGGVGLARAFR
jgi:hypothetical protein